MRYRMMADAQELRRAGLAGLIDQPWQGGGGFDRGSGGTG